MRAPTDIPSDAELPQLIVRAVKAMVAEVTAHHGGPNPSGLTVMHGIATRYLADHQDVTTVQLAAHLHVTKQSASEIVGLLESEGFVRRLPHPDDGRARVLQLTDEGVAGLARSRVVWGELVDRWRSLVGPGDLEVVQRAFEAYLADVADR